MYYIDIMLLYYIIYIYYYINIIVIRIVEQVWLEIKKKFVFCVE